jgi:glutaredoxin
MNKRFLWVGLLVLANCGALAEGVYRWVDKSGKVQYGEMPGEEAVQVERKKFGIPPEDDKAALPYETRHASENFPVTLYVSGNCSDLCKKARDLLNKRGIPYTEKNLVKAEEVEAFTRSSGGDIVPTLAVGPIWLKGFLATQWSSELDSAGYPKIAPYRPVAPAKPPAKPPVADNPVTEN